MAGGSNYSTGAIGSSLATPDYVIVIVYLVGILAVGLWVGKFCCSVKKIALFLKFYPSCTLNAEYLLEDYCFFFFMEVNCRLSLLYAKSYVMDELTQCIIIDGL